MNSTKPLSLGAVARQYGIPVWRIRRVFERGLLPEPDRVGPWRVISQGDLPALEAALRQAGYLRETEVACE